MTDDSGNDVEELLRIIAATILLDTVRKKGTSISQVRRYLSKLNISFESLLELLKRRFIKVGLKLRIIGDLNSSDALLFAVVDPDLPIKSSSIDSTSASVLALIYLKSGESPVSIDEIRETLKLVLRSEKAVDAVLIRSLRLLNEEGLIDYDQSRQVVKLTPLGLALLPNRKLLEMMVLRILGEINGFPKSDSYVA